MFDDHIMLPRAALPLDAINAAATANRTMDRRAIVVNLPWSPPKINAEQLFVLRHIVRLVHQRYRCVKRSPHSHTNADTHAHIHAHVRTHTRAHASIQILPHVLNIVHRTKCDGRAS